jgi:hypothetical protein
MPFDVADNPFAVLTAVVAPAILTNACSVLAMGTANRIARVVDRSRAVVSLVKAHKPGTPEYESYNRQLTQLRARSGLLLKALRLFYAALGMFATLALTAIVGSALVAYEVEFALHMIGLFSFVVGCGAVIAIVAGCAFMVQETRMAIQTLTDEQETIERMMTPEKPA